MSQDAIDALIALLVIVICIVVMTVFAKNSRLAFIASSFLISIYTITLLNGMYLVIYYEWLMALFSYISLFFVWLARKSSFSASLPYFAHSLCYFLLGFESKISLDALDSVYYYIMYGLLLMLVLSVIYGRMGDIKCRADSAMS